MGKRNTLLCLVPRILRCNFRIIGKAMISLGQGIVRLTSEEDQRIIQEIIRRQNSSELLALLIGLWILFRLFVWRLEKFKKPIYWIIDSVTF